MAEKNGIYSVLKHPAVYEALQQVFGAERGRRSFANKYVSAKAGDRVLDIGCGPAHLLAHLPAVEYIGWEPNPAYIETARRTYDGRGSFNVGYFGEEEAAKVGLVDIAVVSAVLHHLTDGEARQLFGLLRRVVKPGGRVVSLDCVYVDKQNPIARLLVSLDRGRHARTSEAYRDLARADFAQVSGEVVNKHFPPYTLWVMTAR